MKKDPVKKFSVRKMEIIECARKIITARGMENLTIRGIARELKLTDGALYRHFKNKREIISLLIEDIENTLLETIRAAAGKGEGPLQKLENILSSHLSYAEQRKGVSFLVINETLSLKDKGLQRKMSGVIRDYLDKIKEILREGLKKGEFRSTIDVSSASIAFFGTVQSMVTLLVLSGFKYPLKGKRLRELFDIYKRGVLAR